MAHVVLVAQPTKHIAEEPTHDVCSSIELAVEALGTGVQDPLIPGDVAQEDTQIRDHPIQLYQLGLLSPIGMERREICHVGPTQLVHVVGKWLPLSCVLKIKGQRGDDMRVRVSAPACLPPTLGKSSCTLVSFPTCDLGTQLTAL